MPTDIVRHEQWPARFDAVSRFAPAVSCVCVQSRAARAQRTPSGLRACVRVPGVWPAHAFERSAHDGPYAKELGCGDGIVR